MGNIEGNQVATVATAMALIKMRMPATRDSIEGRDRSPPTLMDRHFLLYFDRWLFEDENEKAN